LRGRHSTRFYGLRSPASPVARENPPKALIFLGFGARLAAARQTDLAPMAIIRRAEGAIFPAVFLFKTAA